MAINFDLNDLLAFRAVAELSNFRKAAESVHLSQPAFSRRIDKLEQALGVRLLERTTRRVTLTAVGRDFERKVRVLLDELDATLLGIRGVAATRMGEVTVACVPSTVYYYLSEVIRRYHERSPKVRVKVLDAAANEVLSKLAWRLDREWPARVLAVAWGPWSQIGMVAELEKHLVQRGLRLISPQEGPGLLLDELLNGKKGQSEVVFAGGAEAIVQPGAREQMSQHAASQGVS